MGIESAIGATIVERMAVQEGWIKEQDFAGGAEPDEVARRHQAASCGEEWWWVGPPSRIVDRCL